MNTPKISVLMPVYNGEKYLREAIESITSQVFKDFEFLIIDDGSTDKSKDVIKQYKDKRIVFIENKINLGLVATLNKGLMIAKGQYIARMDQDDISLPERFKDQVAFMDKHPDVGVCGTWIKFFGDAENIIEYPTNNDTIKSHLFFYNALAHPTVIIRSNFFKKYNLKYKKNAAEDYDLWQRCSFLFRIHNIPKVLLMYRISSKSYTQTYKSKMGETLNEIYSQKLLELKMRHVDDDILEIHKKIGNKIPLENETDVLKAIRHLSILRKNNKKFKVYPEKEFKKIIDKLVLTTCLGARISTVKKIILILSNPPVAFSIFLSIKIKDIITFIRHNLKI